MNDKEEELLLSEVQTLNRIPNKPFVEFVKLTFDIFLHTKESEKLLDDLATFCENIGANYNALKNLVKSLVHFLIKSAKRGLSFQLLQDQLIRMEMEETKAVVVSGHWKEQYTQICRKAVKQALMINELVDMEWKFGVTAVTSDGDSAGHSFLQLKLVINKGKDEFENLFMELTLPQFYSFMHEMEKAKSGLELLV